MVNGDNLAVECLAELGGLNLEQLTTLLSWTGQTLGNERMPFRSEVFVTRALRATTVKGCPVCLREDVIATGRDPRTAIAMRGD
ncbi:TniQ family protein [Yoonia sp. MH D7]